MRTETLEILEKMQSLPWFSMVGKPAMDEVITVESWRQAMKWCKTAEWESVQLQVNNVIARNVNLKDYPRFEQWNPTIRAIKGHLDPLITKHVRPVAERERLPDRFLDSVHWDMLEICVETEYSDITEPIFFLKQVFPWYQTGHFPCGWTGPELTTNWEGPMPPGKLVVF